MHQMSPDVRSLVGRRVHDAAGRFQDLLYEIRRLRRETGNLEQDRQTRERLLLILGLLNAHGPREDRLLRYQLEEMGQHLRSLAGAGLAF